MIRLALAMVCLALGALSCGDSKDEWQDDYRIFRRDDHEITIGSAEQFLIEMEGNPRDGDDWRIFATPVPGITWLMSASGYDDVDEYGNPPPEDGQWYFSFETVARGTTEIELFNCYRCSPDMFETPAPQHAEQAEHVTFTVTVSD